MSDLFTIAALLLFLLALLDLSVGVSNDAVNFLNSAIGSKVAPRYIILIVASAGILAGALFSSGMMEVARKGIFNPEMFSFADVMVIFLAVMLADVLLLDLFNTYALPTSTTVSIVFELLGAAVAIALVKILLSGSGLVTLAEYINGSQAMIIIAGIFLSVVFAFAIGAVVQYVTRALFTFQSNRYIHGFGLNIWSAVALTAISYFLLIKGAKGAAFIPEDLRLMAYNNGQLLAGILFVFWLALSLLLKAIGLNVLRGVVLFGTFALAMAFASNDLVNFIGVPLAGLASWRAWRGSGEPAEEIYMTSLAEPVRGDTLWLLLAGGIMITVLWLSAKARSVTETEVNLGRQNEGVERFRPGLVSRTMVRSWLGAAAWISQITPSRLKDHLDNRFRMSAAPAADAPAFDLIRASVNLVVASSLIAFATSLKLPLSTTYVSFMVAMGTSLADRAWGRDGAVYRVAGVLSVIGGWFVTAMIAFTAAGVFALLIHFFGILAVAGLLVLAVVLLRHNHGLHRRRRERSMNVVPISTAQDEQIWQRAGARFTLQLRHGGRVLNQALSGLLQENRSMLAEAVSQMESLSRTTKVGEQKLVLQLRENSHQAETRLLELVSREQDLLQSVDLVAKLSQEFVLNMHQMPPAEVTQLLSDWNKLLPEVIRAAAEYIEHSRSEPEFQDLMARLRDVNRMLIQAELSGLRQGNRSLSNYTKLLNIALELKDVVRTISAAVKLLADGQAARARPAAA